jgi:hypothetical protein
MTSRLRFYSCAIALLALFFVSKGLLGGTRATHQLSLLSANPRAIWKETIPIEFPSFDSTCQWVPDYPGKLIFTSDYIVAGIHADCWGDSQGSIHSVSKHTLNVLILVNPQTGATMKRVSWSDVPVHQSDRGPLRILNLAGGRLLVQLGSLLKLLSAELEEIGQRDLGAISSTDTWIANAGAAGDAVVLLHYNASDETSCEFRWISLETLADTLVQSVPPCLPWFAIGDKTIYFSPLRSLSNGAAAWDARASQESASALERGSAKEQILCSACGIPKAVVSGDVFLTLNPWAAFSIVSPQGDVKYRGKYGTANDSINAVAVAKGSNLFAFGFGHLGNGWMRSRAVYRAVVVDAKSMRSVLELETNGYSEKNGKVESWSSPALALSPDGSRLATLEGPRLSVLPLR